MSIFGTNSLAAPAAPAAQPASNNGATGQPAPAVATPQNNPQINPNGFTTHDSVVNNAPDLGEIIRNTTLALAGAPVGDNSGITTPQQQYFGGSQQQPPQQSQQTQQPNQQQQQGTQSPPPLLSQQSEQSAQRADAVIENFLRFNPLKDPLDGVDRTKVAQAMGEGNIDAMMDTVANAANASTRNAMRSFMLMMPSLVETIKTQVLASVNSMNNEGQLWQKFVTEAPEYEALRHVVEPALKAAIANNPKADRALVFKAVAQMYSSMAIHSGLRPAQKGETPRGSDAFDLGSFLGN